MAKTIKLSSVPTWIWAFIGCLILWAIAMVLIHQFSLGLFLDNATLASFLALLSLGQMVVIASGAGSIDLSIPYVLTLSAFVAAAIMNGSNGNVVVGIAVAVGCAIILGLLNGALIAYFRVAPIITTLATGYIADTVILQLSADGIGEKGLSPVLNAALHLQVDGAGLAIGIVVAMAIVVYVVISRFVYGRQLLAMGQSRAAASLADVPITRMILINFTFSAMCGGIAGVLLAAFDGGAFINMAGSYLLTSIAAVVIGGTLISGGRISVWGALSGALFLSLLVTILELSHLNIGSEDIIEGMALVGIVVISQKQPALE